MPFDIEHAERRDCAEEFEPDVRGKRAQKRKKADQAVDSNLEGNDRCKVKEDRMNASKRAMKTKKTVSDIPPVPTPASTSALSQGASIVGAPPETLVFDNVHKAPYIVYIRFSSQDKTARPESILNIPHKVDKANVKYTYVGPYCRNERIVYFTSRDEANRSLSNKYLSEQGLLKHIFYIMLTLRKEKYGVYRQIFLRSNFELILSKGTWACEG